MPGGSGLEHQDFMAKVLQRLRHFVTRCLEQRSREKTPITDE
jgi:hypothetical protein